ncbi:hypothetical protein CJ255_05635 [Candidatus Viridilinea mediisalina]|uniref:Uncharacterized protein n=1 Tax=Candidatus Viridilinea mediisalina TaxID=2024553 RepID=A0A2A6RLV7_9CHLR|nr:hypothetical protein CJ255_05635 [Candidatus Viridilinea mediisalina]
MGVNMTMLYLREQGTENREQGTENREQGTGNRTKNRTKNKEQRTENKEQGTGNREQSARYGLAMDVGTLVYAVCSTGIEE